MTAFLGSSVLVVAFWVALASVAVGVTAGLTGSVRAGRLSRRGVYFVFAAVSAASAALIHAFATHDFSLEIVHQYSDRNMPMLYVIAAFWGGQAGSLLFWCLALTAFSAAAVYSSRHQIDPSTGWVHALLMGVAAFFLSLLVFVSDPFETYYLLPTPADGLGLNPLLQNVWMTIHPPTLLIGFASFTVPFAYGMAAMITRRLDNRWVALARPWALVSWAFLALGSLLGARWAYEELGWGGYWAWDPVENAALMPWLTATAYLHTSFMQERRRRFGRWNLFLLLTTFWLTIFGTFLTRSGIIGSIHAFAQSAVGIYLCVFLVVLALSGGILLGLRWRAAQEDESGQESPEYLHWAPVLAIGFVAALLLGVEWALAILALWILLQRISKRFLETRRRSFLDIREHLVWLSVLALVMATFGVLWGTVFPTLAEAFGGSQRMIDVSWFSQLAVVVGLVLLSLLGVCGLLGWGRTRTRFLLRNGLVLVLASAVLSFAIAATVYLTRLEGRQAVLGNGWLLQVVLALFLAIFAGLGILVEFSRGYSIQRWHHGYTRLRAVAALFRTNRRRYGAHVVHFGIGMVMFSMVGNAFGVRRHIDLEQGQSAAVSGYHLTYNGLEVEERASHLAIFANLTLRWCGREGDPGMPSSCTAPEVLRPARFDFNDHLGGAPPDPAKVTNEIALKTTPLEDLYVTLAGFGPAGRTASFEVHINPLVFWLWWGGAVAIGGVFVVLWPPPSRREPPVRAGRGRTP